jgi:phage regulator Rha-like protein
VLIDFSNPIIIGAILSFAGLIIANVIQAVRSGRNSKETTEVSTKDANTREFAELREGFVASFEELRRQLAEQRELNDSERTRMQKQLTDQSSKITILTRRVGTLEREKHEIIEHLSAVEMLVPNPPGVPVRPDWK